MIFGIVDYGMGNLLSVKNALEAVGANVRILSAPHELPDVGALVLPGVGAFGKGMDGLQRSGLRDALDREVREKKKPVLGICLGMQLFAERSFELGTHKGLGWITGEVRRLETLGSLRVPHVGWNEVQGTGTLFARIPERTAFYFVHSFHFVPGERSCARGNTEYGGEFVSSVEQDNVLGVQFHPEKSHKYGLSLLTNFVTFARGA